MGSLSPRDLKWLVSFFSLSFVFLLGDFLFLRWNVGDGGGCFVGEGDGGGFVGEGDGGCFVGEGDGEGLGSCPRAGAERGGEEGAGWAVAPPLGRGGGGGGGGGGMRGGIWFVDGGSVGLGTLQTESSSGFEGGSIGLCPLLAWIGF